MLWHINDANVKTTGVVLSVKMENNKLSSDTFYILWISDAAVLFFCKIVNTIVRENGIMYEE